jgi:hypothetical protein
MRKQTRRLWDFIGGLTQAKGDGLGDVEPYHFDCGSQATAAISAKRLSNDETRPIAAI